MKELPYNERKAGSGCRTYKTASPRTFIASGSIVRLATVNDVKAFIIKYGALAGCVKLDTNEFSYWTPDKGAYA